MHSALARLARLATPLALAIPLAACGGTTAPADGATAGPDVVTDAPAAADVNPGDDVAATDGAAPDDAPPDDAAPAGDGGLIGARPYRSRVPATRDPAHPLPLVILLHGYGANGQGQDLYFGLSRQVDARNFLYAYPDGTIDSTDHRFWNATDACCNVDHANVDDVAYINAIIDDMSARYAVDPRQIYLVGHSNGAFMSHRMACDAAGRIAAIVGLAGMNWLDMTRCAAANPVSVLQVHGDADTVIAYNGGIAYARYPSALDTIAGWATRNHCGTVDPTGATLDIDSVLIGAETSVSRATGCAAGGAAELWTIHGGGHIPNLQSNWPTLILDWLFAHARPGA
jgi:polyhydroxybutyrate depolymerase